MIKALLITSIAFIRQFGWGEGGRSILHGGWQVLRALITSESELSRARMHVCEQCGIFDKKLLTCGTPNEVYWKTMVLKSIAFKRKASLGCWCWLPLATRLHQKDCWARANDLNFGWPDTLRPKPKSPHQTASLIIPGDSTSGKPAPAPSDGLDSRNHSARLLLT